MVDLAKAPFLHKHPWAQTYEKGKFGNEAFTPHMLVKTQEVYRIVEVDPTCMNFTISTQLLRTLSSPNGWHQTHLVAKVQAEATACQHRPPFMPQMHDTLVGQELDEKLYHNP